MPGVHLQVDDSSLIILRSSRIKVSQQSQHPQQKSDSDVASCSHVFGKHCDVRHMFRSESSYHPLPRCQGALLKIHPEPEPPVVCLEIVCVLQSVFSGGGTETLIIQIQEDPSTSGHQAAWGWTHPEGQDLPDNWRVTSCKDLQLPHDKFGITYEQLYDYIKISLGSVKMSERHLHVTAQRLV